MNSRLKFQKAAFASLLLIIALPALLAACASADGQEPHSDPNTLVYANLTDGGVDREAVDEFNSTHTDIQIEVRDYFGEDGQSGRDKLLTEIAAGKIPDIIDLGNSPNAFTTLLPYEQLAEKGYLEDLWPYIENDPELGREAVLEAPLKAAEVNGKLYLAFDSVRINTLIGAERIVGDRTSWTLTDLREAFASMPDDSTVLQIMFEKRDAFAYTLCMSLDDYVDLEVGQCSFDCEEFRSALEFINSFPTEATSLSGEALTEELQRRMQGGRQMLMQLMLYRPKEIQEWDYLFGGRASFVGYPTADGSVGSSFYIRGRRLAMSSSCQKKRGGLGVYPSNIFAAIRCDTAQRSQWTVRYTDQSGRL